MVIAKKIGLLIISLVFLAACSPSNTEQDLVGTSWKLISLDGNTQIGEDIGGQAITLSFEDNSQAGGSGGCNSFGATYEANPSNDSISFSQLISTLMACTGAGIDEIEATYFAALNSANRFEIILCKSCPVVERLTITGGGHTLIFERS